GISITAGPINRVLVQLPGESYLTGAPPYSPANGGTGGKGTPDSPNAWTAGMPQPVVVYAVDQYWNQTSSAATVTLSAPSDSGALGVGTKQMLNGTTTFNVTLFKARDYNSFSQTLQATVNGLSN